MKKFDAQIFMAAVRHEAGEIAANEASLATLRKLLALEGDEFLMQAYRVILGRKIDNAGLAAYSQRAKSLRGKIHTLGVLWFSPERVYLSGWQRTLLAMGGRILGKGSARDKAG